MTNRSETTESQSAGAPDQQSPQEVFDPAAYFDRWLADLEATRKQLAAKARKAAEESLQEEAKEELKHFVAGA